MTRKVSFNSISNLQTSILILGTLPGEKSLEINEYYGNSRNSFWKIISAISNYELPVTYEDKKALLYKTKIGVWDVVHKGNRKGSLDKDIKNEIPNNLNGFIEMHKKLKSICFNGKGAEKLFDKYFKRNQEIKYISLPSTSPAHAAMTFEAKCEKWSEIFK